ncbi:MAG: hypothetical protein IJB86_09330 [Clostridia bacterium]|nr:hypothetical protein [Clostridia bacterium]
MKLYTIENSVFSLTVGSDGTAKSLVLKSTEEECLYTDDMPLFTLTQDRLFNNELKLSHPNKRTVFESDSISFDGRTMTVGFSLIRYKALIDVSVCDRYCVFTLKDFSVSDEDFKGLRMSVPPVSEFRILQLAVKERERFGEWLNVAFDDKTAVNVLAVSPHARIDSVRQKGYRIMTADAVRGIKLKGCSAALIVSETDMLLDAVEDIENDFDLPKGVKSRRSDCINRSVYWTGDICPDNVDEHIAFAKKGGFSQMLVYYSSIVKERGYTLCGNYDFNDNYKRGFDDLSFVINKIKDAGITPGLHFLQTHIGISSRYVTPRADHRLNIKERFTLSRALSSDDETVYVEQNPEGTVMADKCRVLKFGEEIISYESYEDTFPYCFTGCKRGHYGTYVTEHPKGESGGVLDVSEFGASSIYLDQNTDLQDEIAEKIAKLYNCGFEFVYFDGSEGTAAPFEYNIPLAQYRVWKKLGKEPLFSEGAAKSHFSWHMLSGGNAFDVFPTSIFKQKIIEHPFEQAPRTANDFTRIDFGWWGIFSDTQPDTYEFGTSRAAAFDCPIAIQAYIERFRSNARADDILEVLRRWEDVRTKHLLTEKQKSELKNADREHTLIINEAGEYELLECKRINCKEANITAYLFERNGLRYASYWHNTGEGEMYLPLGEFECLEEIASDPLPKADTVPVSHKRYIKTRLSASQLTNAFEKAELK